MKEAKPILCDKITPNYSIYENDKSVDSIKPKETIIFITDLAKKFQEKTICGKPSYDSIKEFYHLEVIKYKSPKEEARFQNLAADIKETLEKDPDVYLLMAFVRHGKDLPKIDGWDIFFKQLEKSIKKIDKNFELPNSENAFVSNQYIQSIKERYSDTYYDSDDDLYGVKVPVSVKPSSQAPDLAVKTSSQAPDSTDSDDDLYGVKVPVSVKPSSQAPDSTDSDDDLYGVKVPVSVKPSSQDPDLAVKPSSQAPDLAVKTSSQAPDSTDSDDDLYLSQKDIKPAAEQIKIKQQPNTCIDLPDNYNPKLGDGDNSREKAGLPGKIRYQSLMDLVNQTDYQRQIHQALPSRIRDLAYKDIMLDDTDYGASITKTSNSHGSKPKIRIKLDGQIYIGTIQEIDIDYSIEGDSGNLQSVSNETTKLKLNNHLFDILNYRDNKEKIGNHLQSRGQTSGDFTTEYGDYEVMIDDNKLNISSKYNPSRTLTLEEKFGVADKIADSIRAREPSGYLSKPSRSNDIVHSH